MSPLVALGGLLGALLGTGLVVLIGSRRVEASSAGPAVLGWAGLVDRVRAGARGWSRRAVWAVAAGVVAGIATGWVVGAVIAAAAVAWLPTLWRSADAAEADRLDAVASFTERLSGTLAGGGTGLEQALLATCRTPPGPIAGPLADLEQRLAAGAGLDPALRALAEDLDDPLADMVVTALLLASRHPAGGLTAALDRLAAHTRTAVTTRRRIDASRQGQRTAVRIIVITALVLTALLSTSRLAEPYSTPGGQLVLAALAALGGTALWWLGRMARTPRPARLLQPRTAPAAELQQGAETEVTGR